MNSLLDWLQRLDDLALDALQDDWEVVQLEAALQDLGCWQSGLGSAGLSPISGVTGVTGLDRSLGPCPKNTNTRC